MPLTVGLLGRALQAASGGWNRYLVALGALYLALAVDVLTGRQFLAGDKEIVVGGFKVLRPAFSFTYAALFGCFIVWAIGSARTVRRLFDEAGQEVRTAIGDAPEYRLWTLSPVSPSRWVRAAFWLLGAGGGLFLLAFVTVVHLCAVNVPEGMSPRLYQLIGVFGGLVLVFAAATFRWSIGRDWERVRSLLPAPEPTGSEPRS